MSKGSLRRLPVRRRLPVGQAVLSPQLRLREQTQLFRVCVSRSVRRRKILPAFAVFRWRELPSFELRSRSVRRELRRLSSGAKWRQLFGVQRRSSGPSRLHDEGGLELLLPAMLQSRKRSGFQLFEKLCPEQ